MDPDLEADAREARELVKWFFQIDNAQDRARAIATVRKIALGQKTVPVHAQPGHLN